MRWASWTTRSSALTAAVVLALTARGGDGPTAIATDSGGPTATVVPLAASGAGVAGVATGAGAVWVADGRAGTVSRVDPQTSQVVATISLAEPSLKCERCWAAVAGRGDVVWATINSAGPVVARIDPRSNRVAQTILVEVLPSALDVGEDGELWLTATLENTVVRVDSRVGGVVEHIPIPAPSGIAVDKDAIWVTSRRPGASGHLVRLDPRTARVVATTPVGRDPGAVAVGSGAVWVANEADHTISRIEPHTNTVTATIPVVDHHPVGIAIGDGSVWVASRGFSTLSVPSVSRIDPDTNTVVETTPIEGTAPLDVVAGEGSLWIASRNPDQLVRIGPVSLTATGRARDGPPLVPVALGAVAGLLLAMGAMHQFSARRNMGQPAPDGHLLIALLQKHKATTRRRRQSSSIRSIQPSRSGWSGAECGFRTIGSSSIHMSGGPHEDAGARAVSHVD